jgi:hypothetical protein
MVFLVARRKVKITTNRHKSKYFVVPYDEEVLGQKIDMI